MPRIERDPLHIIANDIDSIRQGLSALKKECVGILPELKERTEEKIRKLRQTSPERDSKAPRSEQLAPESSKEPTENDDNQIDANNDDTSHETTFTREQYRENGLKSLISYLQLNGMDNFEEIQQKTPDELSEYFSLQLKEPKNDIGKGVEARAREMFIDNYHEEIEDRTNEDYAEDIEKFIREVNESIEINDNNVFDSYLDIRDFIEKMRLVAINSDDGLNKLAKKFHQAAAEVVKRQEADKAIPSLVDVNKPEKAEVHEETKGVDGDKESKSDKDKKQPKQSFLLRFVGGPVSNLALLATAAGLGGGAVWVYQHIRQDRADCSVYDNVINSGANVANSFNCDNSRTVNNSNTSDNAIPIKKSGDLNQQDVKKILDRADGSYDGIITFKADSNHNYDGSFKQVFAPLGAEDDELLKLKNYAIGHRVSGQSSDEIKFNTYDHGQNFVADVLVLGARASDTKLPDATDVAGLVKDDSIILIGLVESQGQRSQEIGAIGSLTPTATFTATAESFKSQTAISTATKDATASVSGTATPGATETPSVDVPTKTPQTSSEIKKSQRDAVKASLDFNERFTGSNLSFMAPMFLAAGPIIEFGSGLKFLNSVDDEEDDEEKKETKSKKTKESK